MKPVAISHGCVLRNVRGYQHLIPLPFVNTGFSFSNETGGEWPLAGGAKGANLTARLRLVAGSLQVVYELLTGGESRRTPAKKEGKPWQQTFSRSGLSVLNINKKNPASLKV